MVAQEFSVFGITTGNVFFVPFFPVVMLFYPLFLLGCYFVLAVLYDTFSYINSFFLTQPEVVQQVRMHLRGYTQNNQKYFP